MSICAPASALTDTYHYAEHRQPDCVILAAELADCAEFELLESLFRIMGIGCVLFGETGTGRKGKKSTTNDQNVIWVPSSASMDELFSAVVAMKRQSPKASARVASATYPDTFDPKRIILIGASTGGIDALLKTVRHFSEHCPPTLIVQHTGGSFAKSLIRLLDGATPASVKAAVDGQHVKPGNIYMAPGDGSHLCLEAGSQLRVALREHDLVTGHRPSIDALFLSARCYAPHITAAILTGMGRDGANGLLELHRAGAHTIGQDKATSVVYGMPKVAMELGGVAEQLPIERIGPALLRASLLKARV